MQRIDTGFEEQKSTLIGRILLVVIALTNLSQLPIFVERQITRYLSTPVWIVLFLVTSVKDKKISLHGIKTPVVLATIIAIYSYIMRVFIPDFSKSALLMPILLSVFVMINGRQIGAMITRKDLQDLYTVYIITSAVVCANIYFVYLRGNSIVGRVYLYESKNSVSQIIWSGMMLILLNKMNKRGYILGKIIYAGIFAIMLLSLLMMKSRATLISFPIVVIIILASKKMNNHAKRAVYVLLAIVCLLLLDERIFNSFVNDILFAGRNVSSLESLSSNRASEWVEFAEVFWDMNFFIGTGRFKMESLILTALLEYGVIIGILILILAIYPLKWGWKNLNRYDKNKTIFLSIGISYVINGVFEQQAPFGPGVKCYLLWFLLGIFVAQNQKNVGAV